MGVPSWSFSKLKDFDKCKKMFWLKHDQRIPEPERPLPPGKTEHANDRGTRIHEECELYINGTHDDLGPEAAKHFGDHLALVRAMYQDGMVSVEGEWAHDKGWDIVPWKDGWLRLKLDIMIMLSPTHAEVIDLKTGRKFGNEVSHAEQLQLYQLVTFLRYPKLEKVTASLWYLDQPEGANMTSFTYTRAQGLRFKEGFHKRAMKATTCTEFPANPNRWSCQYCSYKGTEHCLEGVDR